MKVGTKSLLFGVHQFILHPILVALAWRKVHGAWPSDLAEWVAILVHDWGYWGCSDMDGPEGKDHPMRGATIAADLLYKLGEGPEARGRAFALVWGHSRSFSPNYLSRLNAPDKVSILFEWKWFYLLRARLSGEIHEFVANAEQHTHLKLTPSRWFRWYRAHTREKFL